MGGLIIIEGVDGVGKSTVARELSIHATVVSFFSRSNAVERFIHRHPTSSCYYLMIIVKTLFLVLPRRIFGGDVICDRYVQTVDTYVPDKAYLHNKILRFLLSPFFLAPDVYIELTADPGTIKSRLAGLGTGKADGGIEYHQKLIKNVHLIELRQQEYKAVFDRCDSIKLKVDTSRKAPGEVAREINNFINKSKTCS